jgi:tRNA pseudouridine38-40 synthase
LEYDGTKYRGWQEQLNARTVMGDLRKAAETVFGAEVELQGAGRTDAGVHAAGQVAHLRVRPRVTRPTAALEAELNDRLPADIAVLEMTEMDNRFHARHDAVSRSYVYQIATRKSAFSKKYVWWVKEPLAVETMSQAAEKLRGRHDFCRFRAPDPSKPGESTIVVVDKAAVERDGHMVLFRIEASHFLWRMVRRLAGVLVRLGKGGITMDDFDTLLGGESAPHLDVAGWTAPAAGLFLEAIHYPAAHAGERRKA